MPAKCVAQVSDVIVDFGKAFDGSLCSLENRKYLLYWVCGHGPIIIGLCLIAAWLPFSHAR